MKKNFLLTILFALLLSAFAPGFQNSASPNPINEQTKNYNGCYTKLGVERTKLNSRSDSVCYALDINNSLYETTYSYAEWNQWEISNGNTETENRATIVAPINSTIEPSTTPLSDPFLMFKPTTEQPINSQDNLLDNVLNLFNDRTGEASPPTTTESFWIETNPLHATATAVSMTQAEPTSILDTVLNWLSGNPKPTVENTSFVTEATKEPNKPFFFQNLPVDTTVVEPFTPEILFSDSELIGTVTTTVTDNTTTDSLNPATTELNAQTLMTTDEIQATIAAEVFAALNNTTSAETTTQDLLTTDTTGQALSDLSFFETASSDTTIEDWVQEVMPTTQATPEPEVLPTGERYTLIYDIINNTEDALCPSGSEIRIDRSGTYTLRNGDSVQNADGSQTDVVLDSLFLCSEQMTYDANAEEEALNDALAALAALVVVEIDQMQPIFPANNQKVNASSGLLFQWIVKGQVEPGNEFSFTINLSGASLLTQPAGTAICDAFVCSYTLPSTVSSTLPSGNYTWSVTANQTKGGTKTVTSSSAVFEIDAVAPVGPLTAPSKPKAISPYGEYTTRSIGFYWVPSSADPTEYVVSWISEYGLTGQIILSANDPSCSSGQCIAYATMPYEASYKWNIWAINSKGQTRSDTLDYRIRPNITTPDALSPNNATYYSSFARFVWTDVRDNVYQYRIQVYNAYSGAVMMDRVYNTSNITCENYRCSVTSDIFLPQGNYYWRVRGYSNNSVSDWSNQLPFTVICSYCNVNNAYYNNYANTVPTPSYPTGIIENNRPTFIWRAITGAPRYALQVWDQNQKLLIDAVIDRASCNVEVCRYEPTEALPNNGTYSWVITGGSSSGAVWGQARASFTLTGIPQKVTFIDPKNGAVISNASGKIIWVDPGIEIETFKIRIFRDSDQPVYESEMSRTIAWCDGTSCSIEFAAIPYGSGYTIEITPVSTYGAVGEPARLDFAVSGGELIQILSPLTGQTSEPAPTFTWSMPTVQEQTAFTLLIQNNTGGSAKVGPMRCGENGLFCANAQMSFTPTNNLAGGEYFWFVEAAGSGISPQQRFSVK